MPFPFALRIAALITFCLAITYQTYAHNGKIAHAYPLGKITVDGNFSDWPKNAVSYPLATFESDTRPKSAADFSGSFRVGYRPEDRCLYFAVTITDDSFIEDTSAAVSWNTQDGLELYIDGRHLPVGSGVASFMYSKKLRNINKSMFDTFTKNASWDIADVVLAHKGNTRYYEWKVQMGEELKAGKSVGFDLQCFDKDANGNFTFSSWGKGEFKFRNPRSLGDIVLMPENEKLATVSGNLSWNKDIKLGLPAQVRITSTRNPLLWVTAVADSLGRYEAIVPAGEYAINFPGDYFVNEKTVYSAMAENTVRVRANDGNKVRASAINVAISRAADLIPDKGILQNFEAGGAAKVDSFIEAYRKYFHIPGVSLALVRDGKLVYHKTYGVRNTFTEQNVDENTLFEAASITKPVFAYAVQRLAERGVIDMDKPLYLYLPYKDIEHDDRYKLITAKHVLTHRTGFPNWRWMNPDNKLNLLFTPGEKYNYSGEGFEYLKLVVEKITGKKVEQVLREEVIGPMKLYHTFFSRNDSLKQMAAEGHYDLLPSYDELPEHPGMAYSMHTEAKAFTNFMVHLLEQKGLGDSTYKKMFSKQSDYVLDPGDEKPPVPTYMGMSLEIRETPFGLSFGHGGNNGDFKCRFEVFKDLRMGYAIFTNCDTSYPLLEKIGEFLIEGGGTATDGAAAQ